MVWEVWGGVCGEEGGREITAIVSGNITACVQLIQVAGHLGVRLPATPPPLLRPNCVGQPMALWLQGLKKRLPECVQPG